MQRCFLVGCILLAFVSNSFADAVDKVVRAKMKEFPIPGLTLTIVKNGKRIKTAAYGTANLEHNVPVTKDTVFEIGSITKQFTATGIMMLAEEGKLSVDDKICKYVKGTPECWKDVTIRHCLTHTSGVKSYTGLENFELFRKLSQEEFIKRMSVLPMEFQPGEKFSYCNGGYTLLGYVIENVSGMKYWDFMQKRIFDTLGMSKTQDRWPGTVIPNRATGYETDKQGKYINRDFNLTDICAAGAIASTIDDMAKWNAALDTDKLLSRASKEQMWTSGKLNDGKPIEYGFGFFVKTFKGHKNIRHSGSTSGFSSDLERYPEDGLAIIVLTNSDSSGVATKVAQAIAALYLHDK